MTPRTSAIPNGRSSRRSRWRRAIAARRSPKEKGLQYVGLDGTVGIIANGAGLAMSTVDIVKQVGGAPANFLDIGGGASAEVMVNALSVINTDPNVRAIFINIFSAASRAAMRWRAASSRR